MPPEGENAVVHALRPWSEAAGLPPPVETGANARSWPAPLVRRSTCVPAA
jgi:hypothetical protein